MNDSEILELREEYESSKLKIVEFADHKGLDYWKTRYALRKALKLRREASGEISFTSIKMDHKSSSINSDLVNNIIITTSNGTTIQIPS